MIRKKHITLCFSLFLALSMVLGQLIPVTATDEVPAEVPVEETGTSAEELVKSDPEPVAEEDPGVTPTEGETPDQTGEGGSELTAPAGDGQGEEPTIPTVDVTETTEEGEVAKPEEEGEQDYFGEADGVKVKAVAAKGAFPEGAILKVAKLDPESAEYKKAAETLDSQNYEYSGFVAMDIHFEVDGQEVEPAADKGDVRVELQVDKKELPQENAAEAIETLEVQHHEEQGAVVTAKPVAKAADNSVVEVGQEVKADFPVENFSTFTITWKGGNFNSSTFATLTAHLVDENGNEISSSQKTADITGSSVVQISSKAPSVNGMSYKGAYVYEGGEKKPFTTVYANRTGSWAGYKYSLVLKNGDEAVLSITNQESSPVIDIYFEYENAVYDLYTYLLIPGKNPDDQTDANLRWMGAGIYKIKAPTAPKATEKKTPYTDILSNEAYDLRIYDPNDPDKVDYIDHTGGTYPNITYNGKKYRYDPAGVQAGTYSIDWFRLVDADGANIGSNKHNSPGLEAGNPAYHLDGQIVFVDVNKITVDFKVKKPGQSMFGLVGNTSGEEPFSAQYESGINESLIARPNETNSTWRQTIVEHGVTYKFDGWYKDEDLKIPATWDQRLNSNQTYYGSYKPKTVTLQVTNTVTGNMGNYSDPFTYELQLFEADGKTPSTYQINAEGISYEDGVHKFNLKHGENTKFLSVPSNLIYKVT
ncbi:DUF7601 domain-containing protein [Faecalibaculum rodentium]|uniref:DUF7601 domain-containing protein n=1 Tax=Faecalibaculum rodentium TaxID=1702221 RepID=UPI002731BAF7|nr:hypothetical protein [Faecalibaculum rodentium]